MRVKLHAAMRNPAARCCVAAALALAPLAPAFAQTVLFTEDFSDATATVFLDLGNDNRSEKYQPTYYFPDPADAQWVFLNGTYLASSALTGASLPDGDKAILLNEGPQHAIALKHSIAVAPGTPLTLTFDHWGDNRPNTLDYLFEVYANQTLIGTVTRGYGIPGPGATASLNWFADGTGQLLLSFRDMSAGEASGIIDNLVLTAIPEPGAYALLLAGLGLMGFVASRRRRSLQAA